MGWSSKYIINGVYSNPYRIGLMSLSPDYKEAMGVSFDPTYMVHGKLMVGNAEVDGGYG